MNVLAILAADEGGNASGGLIQMGILLLIPLAMYFLMIRPQRKRMRDQQAMQSSLEVGDEVMTASGIYGFITGFEDDIVWVEIDDDVQIRVSRGSLQGKVRTGTSGATSSAGDTSNTTSSSPATTAERVTPSVKGRRPGASKSGGAASAPDTADDAVTDTAERTKQE